jgi:general stress protein 26
LSEPAAGVLNGVTESAATESTPDPDVDSGPLAETDARLDDLVAPGSVVMVMTMIEGRHSSRPVTVAEVDRTHLRFLVDGSADWMRAISEGRAEVHVSLSDNRKNTYASLNGKVRTTVDRSLIERLWSAPAEAFFDGPTDPNLAVLVLEVEEGSYWDAPSGRLGQAIALLKAALGRPSDAGDHGAVII